MIEVLAGLFYGVIFGLAGMLPFVSANTILEIARSYSTFASPLEMAVFAVALSFSHLVFQVIPSTLFFFPTTAFNSTIHLQRNLPYKVAITAVYKSLLASLAVCILLLPIFALFQQQLFDLVRPFTLPLILFVIFAAFWNERGEVKTLIFSMCIFMLSGAFGYFVFTSKIASDPLFPMLSGLFGFSSMLFSLNNKTNVKATVEKQATDIKLIVIGCIAGGMSSLLPAMTPAFLAAIVFLAFASLKKQNAEKAIQLTAAIVFSKMFFEFFAAFEIGKARSLAATFILPLDASVSGIAIILFTGIVAFLVSMAIILQIQGHFSKIGFANNRQFIAIMAAVLLAMIFATNGMAGLLIAIAAAGIGALAEFLNVNKSFTMGALLLPTLSYIAF